MSSSHAFQASFERPMPLSKFGDTAHALTAIYDDDCHLAVWQQAMPLALCSHVQQQVEQGKELQLETITNLDSLASVLELPFARFGADATLFEHVYNIVDMFGCLFDSN